MLVVTMTSAPVQLLWYAKISIALPPPVPAVFFQFCAAACVDDGNSGPHSLGGDGAPSIPSISLFRSPFTSRCPSSWSAAAFGAPACGETWKIRNAAIPRNTIARRKRRPLKGSLAYGRNRGGDLIQCWGEFAAWICSPELSQAAQPERYRSARGVFPQLDERSARISGDYPYGEGPADRQIEVSAFQQSKPLTAHQVVPFSTLDLGKHLRFRWRKGQGWRVRRERLGRGVCRSGRGLSQNGRGGGWRCCRGQRRTRR